MAVEPASFASAYWDTAPLLSRAADLRGDFTDLLSPDDVDSLVSERGLRAPFFRLVQDAEPVTGGTRRAVAGSRTITDLADAEAIRTLHAQGATLVLNSLHRIWPPVVRFCRQMAAELGHPTQCNAYVTPAGNARGFAFHHDTHDVFVLQVAGRKRWQVHRPVVPLPTARHPRSGQDLVPEGQPPLFDVELAAGDSLYLPRGYVHAAQTTDESSIHLTIGVLVTTWYDVLRDLVDLAADELAFRRALPVDPAAVLRADPAQVNEVVRRAGDWLAGLPDERLTEVLDRRLDPAHPPEPLGVLAQTRAAAELSPASRVRPRRGLRWHLAAAGDRVVLTLPDRSVDLPSFTEPAVRRLMTAPQAVRDVAGDELDEPGVLVLVRRLLREGAVVVGP